MGKRGKVMRSGYFTKSQIDGGGSFCCIARGSVRSICTLNLHPIESNKVSLSMKQ